MRVRGRARSQSYAGVCVSGYGCLFGEEDRMAGNKNPDAFVFSRNFVLRTGTELRTIAFSDYFLYF